MRKSKMNRKSTQKRGIVWSTRLTNHEARSLQSIAKKQKQVRAQWMRNTLLRAGGIK